MLAGWYSDNVHMLWCCGHVPVSCMWMVHFPSNGILCWSSPHMYICCCVVIIYWDTLFSKTMWEPRYAFCCSIMLLLAINMLWIVSDTAILTGFGHVEDGNNSDARPKPVLACPILSSCADLSRWYTLILWCILRGLHTCVMQKCMIFFHFLKIDNHEKVRASAWEHFLHTRYPGQLGDAIPCMSHCCMQYECRVYVLRCGSHYWLHRVKKLLLYITVFLHILCFCWCSGNHTCIPTECWIQHHDTIISVIQSTCYINIP